MLWGVISAKTNQLYFGVHSILCMSHFKLCMSHSILCMSHFKLCMSHSILCMSYSKLCILHYVCLIPFKAHLLLL